MQVKAFLSHSTNDKEFVRVVADIEPYSTEAAFKKIISEITSSNETSLLARILADIHLCISNRELPLFVDKGGLLDENGRWSYPIQRIVAQMPQIGDHYIFIVSSRRPNQDDGVPVVHLKELKKDECKQLITALSSRLGDKLKAGEITELADYTGGYPPACIFAVQQVKDDGIAAVLAQKALLVDFRTRFFIKHIATAKLAKEEMAILKLLAEYSPLPLAAVGDALQMTPDAIGKHISRLLDYSLALPIELPNAIRDRHLFQSCNYACPEKKRGQA